MARCQTDKSIERKVIDGFECPLGVYPVDDSRPRQGFTVDFEPGDGDDEEGEWEEWPDRYVFDVVVTASRLESLCRTLFALLPGRVFPILDALGNDAYREVDPYLAYDLVGQERFLDAVRRYKDFLLEDGLVGFGAMAREPFVSVFVDEHKIVTVRVETSLKERVEKVLAAFDLEQVETLSGVDSGTHEHRGVLESPADRDDLLTADEIVEHLRDEWDLVLNVDAESNADDEGKELGMTGWRCLVRWSPPPAGDAETAASRYIETLLTATCLREAEDLALDAALGLISDENVDEESIFVVVSDRLTPEEIAKAVKEAINAEVDMETAKSYAVRWLE